MREAREAARSEVLGELGAERVADAFRVAAAGRGLDVDEVIDGINLAKFVGEDGTPDRDAVAAFVDRIAPEREPASPPDLGQGARGGGQQAPGLNSSQLQKGPGTGARHPLTASPLDLSTGGHHGDHRPHQDQRPLRVHHARRGRSHLRAGRPHLRGAAALPQVPRPVRGEDPRHLDPPHRGVGR